MCIWPAGLPVRLIHKCHISDATSVRPIGALILANTGVANTGVALVLGSELASMSAIARTEDERSESEVASEIGHSVNRTGDSPFSDCINPANPPSDTHAL